MTKFNGNAISSVIFKTIIMSLHRGRFVVVHLHSTFPIDPHNFFSEGQFFLPKNTILVIYGGRTFKAITVKYGSTMVRT